MDIIIKSGMKRFVPLFLLITVFIAGYISAKDFFVSGQYREFGGTGFSIQT